MFQYDLIGSGSGRERAQKFDPIAIKIARDHHLANNVEFQVGPDKCIFTVTAFCLDETQVAAVEADIEAGAQQVGLQFEKSSPPKCPRCSRTIRLFDEGVRFAPCVGCGYQEFPKK